MVVFTALLLDLLAFTMPCVPSIFDFLFISLLMTCSDSLPLFPRIVEDFVRKEALFPHQTSTLLSQTLHFVRSIRTYLFSFASSSPSQQAFPAQWDLTILGGLLAALFSFCQFLISPQIGKLSDRYGRKPVLLASMVGNLVSAALWLFADHFGVYAMSRLVGGLSEGNVKRFHSPSFRSPTLTALVAGSTFHRLHHRRHLSRQALEISRPGRVRFRHRLHPRPVAWRLLLLPRLRDRIPRRRPLRPIRPPRCPRTTFAQLLRGPGLHDLRPPHRRDDLPRRLSTRDSRLGQDGRGRAGCCY